MITWEPWSAPEGERHVAEQPDISLARIADGAFDPYIRAWARDVAAYRGPVMIRLMHEMNGTWYPWGVHVNGNTPAELRPRLAPRPPHLRPRRRAQRELDLVDQQPRARRGREPRHRRLLPGQALRRLGVHQRLQLGQRLRVELVADRRPALPRHLPPARALRQAGDDLRDRHDGRRRGRARSGSARRSSACAPDYPHLHAVLWYDDIDGGGLDFRLQGQTAGALSQPGTLGKGWLQKPTFRALR